MMMVMTGLIVKEGESHLAEYLLMRVASSDGCKVEVSARL